MKSSKQKALAVLLGIIVIGVVLFVIFSKNLLKNNQGASIFSSNNTIATVPYSCSHGDDIYYGDFNFGNDSPNSFEYTELGLTWHCNIVAGQAQSILNQKPIFSTNSFGTKTKNKDNPVETIQGGTVSFIAYRCSMAGQSDWIVDYNLGSGPYPSQIIVSAPNGLATCDKLGPIHGPSMSNTPTGFFNTKTPIQNK